MRGATLAGPAQMPSVSKKISLIYFVIATLLVVGLVPLVLTGWFLSDKSGRELRSAENRYQIQLVQEKARQIEIFGRRYELMVDSLTTALTLSKNAAIISSHETEAKLASILRENPDLLAIDISPVNSEPLTLFRPGITSGDVTEIASRSFNDGQPGGVWVGPPQRVASSNILAMTFSSRVFIDGQHTANIVAIASMEQISQSIVGITAASDAELWKSGLPMVFVVDGNGNVVFHPDRTLATENRPMANLKIVTEWLDGGNQVQSALVPFNADYNGVDHAMIGAYSTARIGGNQTFGIITMQDESRALASVGEMRTQTWLISMAFALFALIAGLILSRYMTTPIIKLAAAARQFAAGDLSTRVRVANLTELGALGETFNSMTETIEQQIEKLARAATENRELFVGTVKALAAAIDGKDKYTRGHSERVSRISVAIGRRLGLDDNELDTLRMSGLLHDVGKIAIDDAILKKPAALTDEEYEIMKQHPQRGYKIMSQIPAMKDFLPGMYMHHEMVNGKGYPQGLKGDEIPLQAKIISVADTFDAMTIDRPYSKGMELEPALERLRSFVGTRYDGNVVEALVEACREGEVGNGIIRQMAAIRAAEASEDAGKEVLSLVA